MAQDGVAIAAKTTPVGMRGSVLPVTWIPFRVGCQPPARPSSSGQLGKTRETSRRRIRPERRGSRPRRWCAAQPTRFPSSVSVDESNPNHAIVTYSGYRTSTPGIPGHVYDVVFDPVAGTAKWTDISYDLGDQPILDSAFDSTSGDTNVSTDFGVNRLVSGTTTWTPAADGLPTVTVSGLRLTYAEERNGNPLRGHAWPRRLPAQAPVGRDGVAA
jgi:hypothetical protein